MLLKGAYCVGEHFVDPQCLICYFWKSSIFFNCRLLQIIGGALRVKLFSSES